ncbi:protein TASOR 2 [Chamaea fasciata]|uniref:protein TASOR 2 n=1 Tax=Chamaea fasciata TaxID=190680 RepID=UPI003369E0DC
MGAGDDLGDSPLDYPGTGDDEERQDEFPEAEDFPGSDTRSTETEADGEFLPASGASSSSCSSSREGISAIRELPRQNFPNGPGHSALPLGNSHSGVPSRRQSVLCRLWKPRREGAAARLSVPAWSPGCSRELSPAPCSARDQPGPAEPGSAPPSPWDRWEDAEPLPEGIPGVSPPSPGSARWSQSWDSPGNSGGSPQEEEEEEDLGAGGIPSPAPLPSWERALCEPWDEREHSPEGSQPFPDSGCAHPRAGQGGIPASPVAAWPWAEHGDPCGEQPEFSDAEDIPEQLPSRGAHGGLAAFEDPSEDSFGGSEQGYPRGGSGSPIPSRNSCIVRSADAAGARTNGDSSSRSSPRTEERGEDWEWDVPEDPGNSVLGGQRQETMENPRLPKRRRRRSRERHLARSLLGTWRSLEELTQNTLDMECLRFHYKLKETLRNDRRPFPTSRSIFPAHLPPSPRSRSPLQVTIPPGGRRSRDPGAALRPGKPRHGRAPPEPRGDERSRFPGARPGAGPPEPFRPEPLRGMLEELGGALRSHLRRVAAAARPGAFFLLETGREPLFDRVKALLQARGLARTDPAGFLGARRRHGERLLVVVRNEDVSCHIHTVPSLLELKRCPGVVFAGVDDAEELSGDTFQELFQAGGFVVSDEELLDSVTLGQLLQVVKVLEKLNRHGRWKWLLHHGESRRLRGDPRDDARRKQLLLRRCQGEELLELLPFHACDRGAAAARRVPCLLELQVRHVHARFAVFLTENAGGSREILESRGILVADVSTFLGTVQELAAPFRRSYW